MLNSMVIYEYIVVIINKTFVFSFVDYRSKLKIVTNCCQYNEYIYHLKNVHVFVIQKCFGLGQQRRFL